MNMRPPLRSSARPIPPSVREQNRGSLRTPGETDRWAHVHRMPRAGHPGRSSKSSGCENRAPGRWLRQILIEQLDVLAGAAVWPGGMSTLARKIRLRGIVAALLCPVDLPSAASRAMPNAPFLASGPGAHHPRSCPPDSRYLSRQGWRASPHTLTSDSRVCHFHFVDLDLLG